MFGVWVLWFRVQGSGLRSWGLWFRVRSLGFRFYPADDGSKNQVSEYSEAPSSPGVGFRVQGLGCVGRGVWGLGCGVRGLWCRV